MFMLQCKDVTLACQADINKVLIDVLNVSYYNNNINYMIKYLLLLN